jgi:hypothetical protein
LDLISKGVKPAEISSNGRNHASSKQNKNQNGCCRSDEPFAELIGVSDMTKENSKLFEKIPNLEKKELSKD